MKSSTVQNSPLAKGATAAASDGGRRRPGVVLKNGNDRRSRDSARHSSAVSDLRLSSDRQEQPPMRYATAVASAPRPLFFKGESAAASTRHATFKPFYAFT